MAKVSVIIPSRGERFLTATVRDLLANAAGDIEIIAVLDGAGWPDPPLPDDPRVHVLRWTVSRGMRAAINAAALIAKGDYLLKCDGHTMWDHGFDTKLTAAYHEDNWILVPRRYALDPINWCLDHSNRKYPVDAHFISEPFGKYGDSVPGLHASPWKERKDARAHVTLDREIGSQGSAYFLSRKCWDWLGPLDQSLYGSFWLENLEMSMKAWMRGGAQMRTLSTFYGHLYKGARFGRGYSTKGMGHENAVQFASWFWMTDQPLTGRVRTMRSLIEEFSPMPTWTDLDGIFDRAHRDLKNPYASVHQAA